MLCSPAVLRMNACNYFGRYITYTGPDFKEGISLTARDDMLRQGRFAYGMSPSCDEVKILY
jgi:hypothetical protein